MTSDEVARMYKIQVYSYKTKTVDNYFALHTHQCLLCSSDPYILMNICSKNCRNKEYT